MPYILRPSNNVLEKRSLPYNQPNQIDINAHLSQIDSELISLQSEIAILQGGITSLVSMPTITPSLSSVQYNSQFTLTASGSVSTATGSPSIDHYEWTLPDNSTINANSITYTAPDNSHIGETIIFKCRAVDTAGNFSYYKVLNIEISGTAVPIINSITWSNDNQVSGESYDLTIDASEVGSTISTYSVVCNNTTDVNIIQDNTNPNIFHITYDTFYNNDIDVIYTITVTDPNNNTVTTTDSKTVSKSIAPPVINNISWNNNTQLSGGSYDLTIDVNNASAYTLTYNVNSDHNDVIIIQDGTNPNIFHITYPTWYNDTTVNYTISVIDTNNNSDSTTDSKVIAKTEVDPTIDSYTWNSNDHESEGTYTLTINASDLNGDSLTYNLTTNNANIDIVQDTNNLNKFTVTYPVYNTDTTVIYTITVTDSTNRTANVTDTIIVTKVKTPPVINNVTWDNDTQNSAGTYSLTIYATDADNDITTYELTCDNNDTTITQDETNPNVFHVTYPIWYTNITVNYTITVTDATGKTDTTTNTKTINRTEVAPVINSLTWSDDNQESRGSYDLTIDASDLNNDIESYMLTADDSNVTIVQDTTNPNIFHITYPVYL